MKKLQLIKTRNTYSFILSLAGKEIAPDFYLNNTMGCIMVLDIDEKNDMCSILWRGEERSGFRRNPPSLEERKKYEMLEKLNSL